MRKVPYFSLMPLGWDPHSITSSLFLIVDCWERRVFCCSSPVLLSKDWLGEEISCSVIASSSSVAVIQDQECRLDCSASKSRSYLRSRMPVGLQHCSDLSTSVARVSKERRVFLCLSPVLLSKDWLGEEISSSVIASSSSVAVIQDQECRLDCSASKSRSYLRSRMPVGLQCCSDLSTSIARVSKVEFIGKSFLETLFFPSHLGCSIVSKFLGRTFRF